MKQHLFKSVFILTLLLSGCASSIKIAEHGPSPIVSSSTNTANEASLQVQYLGVGGHRIQYGDSVVLTGVSFTNPSFLATGPFIPLKSDKQKIDARSEEHTSELQSRPHLVCRLLLEKKKKKHNPHNQTKTTIHNSTTQSDNNIPSTHP